VDNIFFVYMEGLTRILDFL